MGEAADGNEAVNLVADLAPRRRADGREHAGARRHRGDSPHHGGRFPSSKSSCSRCTTRTRCAPRRSAPAPSGFLTKDCELREVVDSVKAVALGEVLISPRDRAGDAGAVPRGAGRRRSRSTSPGRSHAARRKCSSPSPTVRSTTEIGRELFISVKTVKNHLASIYAKLDARDRTQAVISGVRLGIVQLR